MIPVPHNRKVETQGSRGPALRVEALSVDFDLPSGRHAAVRSVNLNVSRGEIVTIVGESGSGKSLLLRAILRLLPRGAALAGNVEIAGTDMTGLSGAALRSARGRLASLVFQDPSSSLDPMAPIGRQIEDAVRAHRSVTATQAQHRALELLELAQLDGASQRYQAFPHQLSGGQRQRVGIALALAGDPDVLLADEPTTALDVSVQARILALLRDLRATLGMTIVLVTHDIGVVAETADRVAVMYGGRLIEEGPVADVLDRPCHPYSRALIGAWEGVQTRARPLPHIPGSPPRLSATSVGCAFQPRCTVALPRCAGEMPPARSFGATRYECWRDRAEEEPVDA